MKHPIRTSGQLGPILRRLRKDLGLSQSALGKLVGLSQERISVIENNPEQVAFDQILDLMAALGSEFLLEVNGSEESNNPPGNKPKW